MCPTSIPHLYKLGYLPPRQHGSCDSSSRRNWPASYVLGAVAILQRRRKTVACENQQRLREKIREAIVERSKQWVSREAGSRPVQRLSICVTVVVYECLVADIPSVP
jgi:hypothetical protein